MEKVWYVYLSNYHQGPFSTHEIRSFLSNGKLTDQTPLWKEGWSQWIDLGKVDILKNYLRVLQEELPPPLPPLPPSPTPVLPRVDALPPAPKFSLPRPKLPSIPLSQLPRIRFPAKLVGATLILVLLVVSLGKIGSLLTGPNWPPFEKPLAMSTPDYHRFLKAIAKDSRRGFTKEFAFSPDNGVLWMATNWESTLSLSLKLSSVPGKILSKEGGDFVLMASGILRGHLATFNEFQLLKGDRIPPGFYRVTLEDLSGPSVDRKKLLEKFRRDFARGAETLLYWGDLPEKVFSQQLADLSASVPSPGSLVTPPVFSSEHHKDILERYQTLQSLLLQMENMFLDELKMMTQGKEIQVFYDKYAREVGTILRDMTLDNLHIQKKLPPEQKNRAEDYKSLVIEGRRIGSLAMEIIEEIKRHPQLSLASKVIIRDKYTQKMKAVDNSLSELINRTSQRIR